MKYALLIYLLYLTSCQTSPETHGIQDHYQGYIPARIAVLPCMPWPDTYRVSNLKLIAAPKEQLQDLCQKFDKHVISGFENQPYLKGYTPNVIEKLLRKNSAQSHLSKLSFAWKYKADNPKETTSSFINIYKSDLAHREEWLRWLETFSSHTRHSDAILLPIIAYLDEKEENNRGLISYRKDAQLLLWLIDTNNGKLIWSGNREASIIRYADTDTSLETKDPKKPVWEHLYQRLLVKTIWKDFPGRILN